MGWIAPNSTRAATAPHYRLYALAGAQPPKPGLLRVARGTGAAIELEVWALPAEAFGRFVAAVPSPLSIGKIELADKREVSGFLVEAQAVAPRRHGGEDLKTMPLDAFVALMKREAMPPF